MAIGTPTQIGVNSATAGGGTFTVTTTGAAPSGSTVFVCAGWAGASAHVVTGVSGGELSWTVDFQQPFSGAAEWGYVVASAPAPSGLASSTVITITLDAGVTAGMAAVVYCEGIATSLPVDVSDGQGQGAATDWDTTSTNTTFADTLVLGGCLHDGLTTNTATNGASELADFQYATEAWTMAVEYKILSATGAASLTGTWAAGANNNVAAFVAYKGAAEPPAADQSPRRRRHSRMTSW